MRKLKWVSSLVLALLFTVLAVPLDALAASITPGTSNITAVTCFYAQTGENMPRRQSGASSLLANSIKDDEGKGLCMLFAEADGATISDIGIGGALTSDKIKKTNAGKPIWAYCIQHHASAYDGLNYTAQSTSENAFWASLSEPQRRAIEITLLCGFPSASSLGGVTSKCDLYAATQALIWEFQYGNNRTVNVVNGKYSGTALSSARETSNFNSTTKTAYNSLVSTVNSFLTEPVITGTNYNNSTNTVTLKWSRENNRYEATVTDSKKVLSNYVTSGSSGGISWEISGNKMTLYTTNKNADNVTLSVDHATVNSSATTDQTLLILDHGTQQEMVIGLNKVDPLPFKIKATVEDTGSCKIIKKSDDGKVANISFKVTGPDDYSATVKTGTDGTFTITNLLPGTYTVAEVMPNDSYIPNASQTVTVQSGKTGSVTFNNKVKKGNFVALKLDAGTGKPIAGAEFSVYDTSNNFIASAKTNAKGEATFKDLTYGKYYAIETAAPSGYKLSEKKISFSITKQGEVITKEVRNDNLMRKVAVYKKGETLTGFEEGKDGDKTVYTPAYEEQYLAGCEVGIYAADDIYTADGTKRFEKDELVDTVTTVSEGPVYSKDLFEGVYYAKEITSPKGFVLNDEPAEILLFDDNQEITFNNTRQKCELTFLKEMEAKETDDVSKLLESVSFGVFNAEQIEALKPDSLLEVIKPDGDGNCQMTVDLPVGYSYYIKELGTADGFVLNSDVYSFELPYADQNVGIIEVIINDGKSIINEEVPEVPTEVPEEPDKPQEPQKPEIPTKPDKPAEKVVLHATVPDTGDNLPDEAKMFLIIAVQSLVLVVITVIRKNKLISYY